MLTVAQAAELIGVSADHITNLIRQGRLVAVNVGLGKKVPRYKIDPAEIETFKKANQVCHTQAKRRRSSRSTVHKYF